MFRISAFVPLLAVLIGWWFLTGQTSAMDAVDWLLVLEGADLSTIAEPLADSIAEPIAESIAEAFTESIAEPLAFTEPIAEAELTAEPIAEASTEAFAESIAEPLADPIAEPIADPLAEPIAESIATPTTPSSTQTSSPTDAHSYLAVVTDYSHLVLFDESGWHIVPEDLAWYDAPLIRRSGSSGRQ